MASARFRLPVLASALGFALGGVAPALRANQAARELAQRHFAGARPPPLPVEPGPAHAASAAPGLEGQAPRAGEEEQEKEGKACGLPFPGYAPEARPARYLVSGRRVRLAYESGKPWVLGRHRLRIELLDPTLDRLTLWLDPAVELAGIDGPFEGLAPERHGARLDLTFPYLAHRRVLELDFKLRHPVSPGLTSLAADPPWSPTAGGPAGAGEVEILHPAGLAALADGAARGPGPEGGQPGTSFRWAAEGPLPTLVLGELTAVAGKRTDLYWPGTADPGVRDMVARLDRVVDAAAATFTVPAEARLTVLVPPKLAQAPEAGGWLVLDPRDKSWQGSWVELAARAGAALWGRPPSRRGWVDEAVAGLVASRALGLKGPQAAQERYPRGALGPPPKGRWQKELAAWTERARRRGSRVLRGLAAIAGKAALTGALDRLHAARRAAGTPELEAALARPELAWYLGALADRGEELDFEVAEILGSAARPRGELGENAFETVARLRLAHQNRFTGPVKVVFETDFGTHVETVAWSGAAETLKVATRSRVRRVTIDPGGWYPDPDRANNTLEFEGRYMEAAGKAAPRGG